jgi:hypothetical protein
MHAKEARGWGWALDLAELEVLVPRAERMRSYDS